MSPFFVEKTWFFKNRISSMRYFVFKTVGNRKAKNFQGRKSVCQKSAFAQIQLQYQGLPGFLYSSNNNIYFFFILDPSGGEESQRKVRTLYACVGEHESELNFEPNQVITDGKF